MDGDRNSFKDRDSKYSSATAGNIFEHIHWGTPGPPNRITKKDIHFDTPSILIS